MAITKKIFSAAGEPSEQYDSKRDLVKEFTDEVMFFYRNYLDVASAEVETGIDAAWKKNLQKVQKNAVAKIREDVFLSLRKCGFKVVSLNADKISLASASIDLHNGEQTVNNEWRSIVWKFQENGFNTLLNEIKELLKENGFNLGFNPFGFWEDSLISCQFPKEILGSEVLRQTHNFLRNIKAAQTIFDVLGESKNLRDYLNGKIEAFCQQLNSVFENIKKQAQGFDEKISSANELVSKIVAVDLVNESPLEKKKFRDADDAEKPIDDKKQQRVSAEFLVAEMLNFLHKILCSGICDMDKAIAQNPLEEKMREIIFDKIAAQSCSVRFSILQELESTLPKEKHAEIPNSLIERLIKLSEINSQKSEEYVALLKKHAHGLMNADAVLGIFNELFNFYAVKPEESVNSAEKRAPEAQAAVTGVGLFATGFEQYLTKISSYTSNQGDLNKGEPPSISAVTP